MYNTFKISDETFYTQSQIMVEKVPEFSAESVCLRQGMVHHYLTLCVECLSEIMFPESKNIHSQTFKINKTYCTKLALHCLLRTIC